MRMDYLYGIRACWLLRCSEDIIRDPGGSKETYSSML